MIKILSFGRSCKAYLRLYEKRCPELNMCCEDCGRSMHKHGYYLRSVVTKYELISVPIYRWLCPTCRKTVSLLPDFLVPWARAATWIREGAMKRRLKGHSFRTILEGVTLPHLRFSRSTIKRWWTRHLHTASAFSLWIAGQLTTAENKNFLELFPKHLGATPVDTVQWLQQLIPLISSKPRSVRGYWSWLNTRIPTGYYL